MARVEYTPARRIAMQATMGMILLGTCVLASVVDYNIRRAGRIRLAGPITVDDITFRLPDGWAVSQGDQGRDDTQPGDGPRPDTAPDPTPPNATPPAPNQPSDNPTGGDQSTDASTDASTASASAPGITLRTAIEPAGQRPPRVLSVLRQRVRVMMSPLEYLDLSGLLRSVAAVGGEIHRQRTIVNGWPGLILEASAPPGEEIDDDSGSPPPGKILLLTTVLPSREAVTIRIEGQGSVDEADLALLQEVAGGLSFAVPAPPAPGGTVTLANGVSVKAPADFLTLPEPDSDTTERVLLGKIPAGDSAMNAGGDFGLMLVELVPMRLFPDESVDAITAALSTHDPAWLLARVTRETPNRWRIDRPNVVEMPFPQQAFLMADDRGEGVLAIFHGTSKDLEQITLAWQHIAAGVTFDEPVSADGGGAARAVGGPNNSSKENLSSLLDEGARFVSPLRQAGFESLNPGAAEQWWLLSYPFADNGWMHVSAADGVCKSERCRRTWDLRYVRVEQEWESAPDAIIYKSGYGQQDGQTDYAPAFTQVVTQSASELVISLTSADGARMHATMQTPPQFIGAGWLPAALGRVGSAPVVIRTDRAPWIDTPQLTPISILVSAGEVSPGDFAAPGAALSAGASASGASSGASAPNPGAPADAAAGALRCVTAEVNGSGELSRWFYRPDGSLDHVEAGGGLRVTRSDAHEIGWIFKNDRMLTAVR